MFQLTISTLIFSVYFVVFIAIFLQALFKSDLCPV